MNKVLIMLVLVFAIVSCNTKTKVKSSGEESNTPLVTSENNESGDSKVVHLTTETFKQKVYDFTANQEWKYEGTVPCIVDFYADWCGPCKSIAPTLEELAKTYDGKIIIYKVDTDKQQELASAFGIRSIPSILFVPANGQPQMAQGAIPRETFVKAIEEVLLAKKIEG